MHTQLGSPGPSAVFARHDDGLDWQLLNEFQRDFPLQTRPFARLARSLACAETRVIERIAYLQLSGAISRVGPVFSPRRIGASTLAALQAPVGHVDEIAAAVSAFAGVNHNYLREHEWNLWFVVTAPDRVSLARVLRDIHRATRCPIITLPLETEYHIDLGFDLGSGARVRHGAMRPVMPQRMPERDELSLMAAIQSGLPILKRPFQAVGRRAGLSESAVIRQLHGWLDDGTLKRFGVVVRHHELGWRANAMGVWDVPDAEADRLGQALAAFDGVNLCYRRRRAAGWPYNLYCMIHGHDRAEVHDRLRVIKARCGLQAHPHELLFSTRRFKQCGARYAVGADA